MRIFILLQIFRFALNQRLDFNSPGCRNYLNKFEKVTYINGSGPTSLAFKGDCLFIYTTFDAAVALFYFDSLYNDPIYYGLSKEDGKLENTTCLDLKLFQFSQSDYTQGTQLNDLQLTAYNNSQKLTRFFYFKIKQIEFQENFVQTNNSHQSIYIGYYALAYYAAGTNQVLYTFYFQLLFQIRRRSLEPVSSLFIPWNQYETQNCLLNQSCIIKPSTTLKFCTDVTCNLNTIPNLQLFDQFYIQQVVNIDGLKNFTLINTQVYYIGEGLMHYTEPLAINNSQLGQVTILLKADIVWRNVTILVTSILAKKTGETFQTSDPVTGQIQILPCIRSKQNENMTCSTCEEECILNEFARQECVCSNDDYSDNVNSGVILGVVLGVVIVLLLCSGMGIIFFCGFVGCCACRC